MKIKNTFLVTSATLLLLGVSLLGQSGAIPVGKKGTVTLRTTVRVGDTLLPSGRYQIHQIFAGSHLMVFQRRGKEVARAKCEMQRLGDKVEFMEVHYRLNAAGEKTITEIRIRGENIKHVF